MGHRYHRSPVLLQVSFKPLYALGIEMVRRLIEQQHIRLTEQQAAKGHPSPLSPAECRHHSIRRRTVECVHRPFELGIDLPAIAMVDFLCQFTLPRDKRIHLLIRHRLREFHVHLFILLQQGHHFPYAFLHHLDYGLVRIHLRLLLQISHRISRSPDHLSLIGLLHARDYLHQSRFAGTVETDYPDLRTIEERQIYVFQYYLVVMGQYLAHTVHRKNYLLVRHSFNFVQR